MASKRRTFAFRFESFVRTGHSFTIPRLIFSHILSFLVGHFREWPVNERLRVWHTGCMELFVRNTISSEVPNNARARVLVAEDDNLLREYFAKSLRFGGFQVATTCDGEAAWQALRAENFDILVTDYDMPRLNGAQLIQRLRDAGDEMPVIIASGSSQIIYEHLIFSLKISGFLVKPFHVSDLIDEVELALTPNRKALSVEGQHL
jgi:CheY-like chemotaxis protein